MEIDKTFSVHDSTVNIWRSSAIEDWDVYEAIRMSMVRRGFSFHQDPQIKKHFRRIANSHHHGVKRNLHFHSSLSGRHTEFIFYEDVIRDNPNGGRYHFDKLAKMPYLLRKSAELEIGKICKLLVSTGFTDQTEPTLGKFTAPEMVAFHQRELSDFQGSDFYARERSHYNITDADGRTLHDGETRHFWDFNGHIARGVVHYHINNMWFVVINRDAYTAVANFNLFTWRPEMGRKRKASERVIKNHLDRLVKKMRFESAIVLRDKLAQMKDSARVASEQLA